MIKGLTGVCVTQFVSYLALLFSFEDNVIKLKEDQLFSLFSYVICSGCENTNHDLLSQEKLDAVQPLISSIREICYRNSMASLPAGINI